MFFYSLKEGFFMYIFIYVNKNVSVDTKAPQRIPTYLLKITFKELA